MEPVSPLFCEADLLDLPSFPTQQPSLKVELEKAVERYLNNTISLWMLRKDEDYTVTELHTPRGLFARWRCRRCKVTILCAVRYIKQVQGETVLTVQGSSIVGHVTSKAHQRVVSAYRKGESVLDKI